MNGLIKRGTEYKTLFAATIYNVHSIQVPLYTPCILHFLVEKTCVGWSTAKYPLKMYNSTVLLLFTKFYHSWNISVP